MGSSCLLFGHFVFRTFNKTNRWSSCKFRRVDCRRGCGASVVAHQREVHEQQHCKLSKQPCVFGCGEKIVKAEMDAHIKQAREYARAWFALSAHKYIDCLQILGVLRERLARLQTEKHCCVVACFSPEYIRPLPLECLKTLPVKCENRYLRDPTPRQMPDNSNHRYATSCPRIFSSHGRTVASGRSAAK